MRLNGLLCDVMIFFIGISFAMYERFITGDKAGGGFIRRRETMQTWGFSDHIPG